MIYHNTDYYLYFMAPKFPNCVVTNTTNSPKAYDTKWLKTFSESIKKVTE